MIIAVNLLNYTSELAGNGTFARRVLGQLQQLDHENEYCLIVRDIPGIQDTFAITAENFRVHRVRVPAGRIGRILFEQLWFPRVIRESGAQLLYSPSLSVPLRLKSIPMVNTIHDLTPFVLKKYGRLRHAYYLRMARRSAKRVSHVVTVSENSRRDIERFLNIPDSKVSIVYNFLEDDFARITPQDSQDNADAYGKYFLFVGTVQPGKNIRTLIDAFDLYLRQAHAEARELVIAGKYGWYYEEILEYAETRLSREHIHFTGYVGNERLKQLYVRSSALVYPTLYEGFGIPPLEAMALEVPVVASRVASIPEVVGDAAILVDPLDYESIADALTHVSDPDVVAALKPKMRRQAARFDGATESRKLLELFRLISA